VSPFVFQTESVRALDEGGGAHRGRGAVMDRVQTRAVPSPTELDRLLLRKLLDRELDDFREALENEDPGLSDTEIERYMRAAAKFAARLAGDTPRTRGRSSRGARDGQADRSTGD
jgi:hypothetical protein